MSTFSADLERWIRKSERRMEAVVKQSAQAVIEIAQTPQAKGGLMPVDTGFLRNTGVIALNSAPSGPAQAEEGDPGAWDVSSITLTINDVEIGDTIVFGWSAVYARKMEERYGFAQSAAMQWPSVVAVTANELRTRIL